jgi:hypothetical protein
VGGVQILLSITSVAVKFTKWLSLSPSIRCCKWVLVWSQYKHYEFVLAAEAKAKSVTNNLPLLSV